MPEEKIYIGTKIVKAVDMRKAVFVQRKSNGEQKILETEDCDGYMVTYEDGYESWSPRETFERAYREVTAKEKDLVG